MTIKNDMEAHALYLRLWREGEDRLKFRAGLRVARLQTFYGDGTIDAISRDAGYSPTTLYSRKDVAIFIVAWASAICNGNFFHARGIFDENPAITYTHVRMAIPNSRWEWDFEDACDALVAVTDGDPEWEEYEKQRKREVILPMTTDAFGRYITWKRGGQPSNPIFKARGRPLWLLKQAWGELWRWERTAGGGEVEIVIREVR